jgi:Cu/Ag efflux pump CusA
MTSTAMICGMLPTALQIGRQSEIRSPLAYCIIGGLFMSTLLSLLVIPCIYCVFDDVQAWAASKLFKDRKSSLVQQVLVEEQN